MDPFEIGTLANLMGLDLDSEFNSRQERSLILPVREQLGPERDWILGSDLTNVELA